MRTSLALRAEINSYLVGYCEEHVVESIGLTIGMVSRIFYTNEFNRCVQAVYADPVVWNDFTRTREN